MPLADDSDLILDLELSVMRQAMSDLARWRRKDPQLRMSVNVSGRHIERRGRVKALHQATLDAGVPPASLDLQLTESAPLASGHHLNLAVKQLRAFGFHVWLCGYITGWSSLKYLMWIPINGVKMSQMISVTIGSPVGNALIRSVTGLARELGLRTTIEGIGSAKDAQLAQTLGCDYAQGDLWSPAVPTDVIDEDSPQHVIAVAAPLLRT